MTGEPSPILGLQVVHVRNRTGAEAWVIRRPPEGSFGAWTRWTGFRYVSDERKAKRYGSEAAARRVVARHERSADRRTWTEVE